MAERGTGVLVVDDERFFREAIREILEAHGFDCRECEDGGKALEAGSDPSVGVVILDIRLPGIDGIEVLSQLRHARPALRVIMLSSSTDQELVLDALRKGACDYLAKPLHDEELLLAVRRAAEGYGVASDRDRLRSRLQSLAAHVEELAARVRPESNEDRSAVLCQGAVVAAAHVLEAGKTSLMLLDEDQKSLRVVAAAGRSISPEEMDPVAVGRGIAGLAIERGEPMVVGDVRDDDRVPSAAPDGRYASHSCAIVPLAAAERPLGVLCAADRADGGVFGEEDLSLLRLLALQISELMNPDRKHDASSQLDVKAEADGDAELARLVCDAVISEVEPEGVIRALLGPLARVLCAAPVALYLFDGTTGGLVCEGECDAGRRSDRATLPSNRGLTGTVLQTGQLVATEEPQSDPRFDPDVDTPEDGVAGPLLCLPLAFRGKVVGVFRAFLDDGARASGRTGEVLSAALSAAVRNVLLYRSLVETIEEVAAARRQSR